MACWRKIVLFGDSLTQKSLQPYGWGAAIGDAFQRKADVINRGFSGYTTRNAVGILNRIFPSGSIQADDVVTIFFGANDAVLPGFGQHVPLNKYESNLKKIIAHVSELGIPKSNILLISPPATEPKAWLEYKIAEQYEGGSDRQNEVTKKYAETCKKVAAQNSCPFVNLWDAFMAEKDYEKLLCDGLHFSESGNVLTAKLILNEISKITEDWKMNLPDWKELNGDA